jgi:hypothetical protein
MKNWNYKEINFDDCNNVAQAIEKYLVFKESTPQEFLPCLDWWFFSTLADNIQWDLYGQYRESFKNLLGCS